jgi:hypothetical protein
VCDNKSCGGAEKDTGYWILDAGFWILVAGCLILDKYKSNMH